jgi:Arc/MetJ-type ribon-helix-helix transcriptional regulator
MESRVTLKIPRPLYERLSVLIEGSGFASVTEFVVYVLRDLVSHQEAVVEGALSAKEVEAIRQRLKTMGYL